MARGARERLGADVAVAVTGSPGPTAGRRRSRSGSSTSTPRARTAGAGREFSFPGDRDSIRARATVGALHLVRRLLTRSRDEGV